MVAWTLPSDVPVIQAPMAGGPSTPELTAAVANAGGFGFLAAGYLSPDDLVAGITATRDRTGGPFGVNIFCPTAPGDPEAVRSYAELIRPESDRLGVPLGAPRWDDDSFDDKVAVVARHRVALVSFTFGCPGSPLVDTLHRNGCSVAVTVTSPVEARMADDAGADLLIVQGTEAGGHQAGFLGDTPNRRPLLSLLEEISSTTATPMIGTGGIMSGVGVADVLAAGALGAQLGTAFLCCPESGTNATHRRAILEHAYPSTMLTRAFSGHWARGLANEFAVRYSDDAPEAYPEIHHLTRPLRTAAAAAGDAATPNLWAGEGWRAVTAQPAGAVIRRIAGELAVAGGADG